MREWLSHWFKFMALPLIIYQVYKLLPFASINWNITEKIYLYPIELLSLTAVVFVLSFYVLLNKYCKKLVIFDLADKKNVSKKRLITLMLMSIIPVLAIFGLSLKQFAEELASLDFSNLNSLGIITGSLTALFSFSLYWPSYLHRGF